MTGQKTDREDRAFQQKISAWRERYRGVEVIQPAMDLPLRRDMVTLLAFVRDNKVVGTPSTGNMPLKAIAQVTARFVNPPPLETTSAGTSSACGARTTCGRCASSTAWPRSVAC